MATNLTMKDLFDNPHKYGLPSFDEYAKAPDKYRSREDDTLACVDNGPTILRRDIKEHVYHIEGYKVRSLHEVEKIARGHGWTMLDMDIEPNLERTTAGKYIMHTYFVLKGNHGRQLEPTDGLIK